MIANYLADRADEIHDKFMIDTDRLETWQAKRPQYLAEYFYMLGVDPNAERTPLKAKRTGVFEGEGFVVDLMHFQSSPGLYVTCNLYRPKEAQPNTKLPTVLYVCGHADRGRNGNKSAYQSHGIWFARHGYVCLMLDTLQRGEIGAIHHGTYRENRWWWLSRGYTSAGVEYWNGVRALDYLTTRPDVDEKRIAVTGISGGGAVTFWIAAADERVKVAVPVSGMADVPSYVGDRIVNGHCDCMFLHNTYQWPWTRIAALVAPRPLLFANSDNDSIFPMNANERVSNRLERVYALYGAGDHVDAQVSIGGHAYRRDLRQGSFRFINTYLKDDSRVVDDSEIDLVTGPRSNPEHPIDPIQLRVFPTDDDIPSDERNTTIDQHFVPIADTVVPKQGEFAAWKDQRLAELKRVTFRPFPKPIPAASPCSEQKLEDVFGSRKVKAAEGQSWLETEPGIVLPLRTSPYSDSDPRRIVLIVDDQGEDDYRWVQRYLKPKDSIYLLSPRGIGATRWKERNPPNYVKRAHVLVGQTTDAGRIRDVIAVSKYLREKHRQSLMIAGHRSGAVWVAYAASFLPTDVEVACDTPHSSHMELSAPQLLNALRICDIPDVIGMAAPRKLELSTSDLELKEHVARIYEAAEASDQLRAVAE